MVMDRGARKQPTGRHRLPRKGHVAKGRQEESPRHTEVLPRLEVRLVT
jgi:hypothetical protein